MNEKTKTKKNKKLDKKNDKKTRLDLSRRKLDRKHKTV